MAYSHIKYLFYYICYRILTLLLLSIPYALTFTAHSVPSSYHSLMFTYIYITFLNLQVTYK